MERALGPIDRRVVLAVVVLALGISMAGCSVVLDDGNGPSATPTTEPSAGAEATAEPTPEPSTGSAPDPTPKSTSDSTPTSSDGHADVPTPTGTPAEDGQYETFDGAALEADHVAALEAAGSFATESRLVIRNASTTRYVNGSYAVEADGPAASVANVTYVDGEVEDLPTTSRYTADGTTYERQVERVDGGVETRYREGSEPYGASDPDPVDETVAYTLGTIARDVVDSSRWEPTGSGQLDGAAVTRYDASGERFGVSMAPGADGAATLVLDEDGVVRYVAYRFVATVGGESTEYVYEAGYTDVGSTTVAEPDWTDRT